MKLHRTTYLVAAGIILVACSSQGEGERCVYANGNADCASGLVCIEAFRLAEYERNKDDPEYVADRCCPDPNVSRSSDLRCELKSESTTGKTGFGGSAGSASADAVGGAGGESSSDSAGGGSAGMANESAGAAGNGA